MNSKDINDKLEEFINGDVKYMLGNNKFGNTYEMDKISTLETKVEKLEKSIKSKEKTK